MLLKQNVVIDIEVGENVSYAVVNTDKISFRAVTFIVEDAEATYERHGYERIKSIGRQKRVIRFCPEQVGEYCIEFFDEKDNLLENKNYECVASSNQAKLIVKNGEIYDQSEKSFVPIGINLAFPEAYLDSNGMQVGNERYSFLGLRQYREWIKNCAINGVNMIRVWCESTYFSPETDECGKLDVLQFFKLDKVFEMANEYGIRIKLTFERFRDFVDDKRDYRGIEGRGLPFDKYSKDGDKKLQDTEEWLREEKYRKLWLKKIREYSLRYGCNPALLAVEFWNEMNAYGKCDMEAITEWNIYMVDEVRRMFPDKIVLNSLSSVDKDTFVEDYKNFCFEKFDWLQFHSYFDQGAQYPELGINPIECIKKAISLIKEKAESCGKMLFLAETGAVNDCHSEPFRFYLSDDDGLMLVDCVYAPLFLGCYGSGNMWHWDRRYIAAKNLYKYYKPLKKLLDGIDFFKESFQTIDLSNEKFYCLVLKGNTNYLAFVRNKGYNWENVLRDKIEVLPENGKIDFGAIQAKDLQTIKIWETDTPQVDLESSNIIIKKMERGVLLKGKC